MNDIERDLGGVRVYSRFETDVSALIVFGSFKDINEETK